MPHRIRPHRPRHSWRRPILSYVLGLGPDQHVDALKAHIEAATVTPTPRLDLVIVQDLEHLEELLEGGIPFARADDAPEPPDTRYIQVPRGRLHFFLWGGATFALMMPAIWRWPYLLSQLF